MRLFNSLGMTIATSSDRPERQRRIGGGTKVGLRYFGFPNPHPPKHNAVGCGRSSQNVYSPAIRSRSLMEPPRSAFGRGRLAAFGEQTARADGGTEKSFQQ